MKKNQLAKKYLSQIIAATMLGGFAVSANAGKLHLEGNSVTIDPGSTVSVSASGIAGTAVLGEIEDICGCVLPLIEFTIANADASTGTSAVRLGLVIDDQNSNSRIEADFGLLNITFENSSAEVSLPSAQTITAIARNDSTTTIRSNLTRPTNLIAVDGNFVGIDPNELLISLSAESEFFSSIISSTNLNRHYTYAIVLQPVSGATASLGHMNSVSNVFTKMPQLQTSCSNQPAQSNKFFNLLSGDLAPSFPSAFVVQGALTVGTPGGSAIVPAPLAACPTTGGGGGGSEEPEEPVTEETLDVDEANGTVNDAIDSIIIPADGNDVTPEILEQLNTTVTDAAFLSRATAIQLQNGTINVSNALTSVETTQKLIEKLSQVSALNKPIALTQSMTSIVDLSQIFSAMVDRTDLQTIHRDRVATIIEAMLLDAGSFLQPTYEIPDLDLVMTTFSTVVSRALDVSGDLTDSLIGNSKLLADTAIDRKLTKLPSSVTGGNIDEGKLKELLKRPDVLKESMSSMIKIKKMKQAEQIEQMEQKLLQKMEQSDLDRVIQNISNALAELNKIEKQQTQVTAQDAVKKALDKKFGGPVSQPLTQSGMLFQAVDEGLEVVSDEVTGEIRIGNSAELYAAISTGIRLAPDSIEDDIYYLADGRAVAVSDGFAIELAPMAADLLGFAAAVETAGFEFSVTDDGSLSFDLGAGERFSGAFAYDNIAGSSAECGAITIVDPVGDPASAGYAFGVNCANGTQQRVTPYVASPVFYSTLLAEGLAATTDRNTGFITISGVGTFKPGFFVRTPNSADEVYRAGHATSNGLAFRALDANNDGVPDYEVISSTSIQLLYGAQ